MQETVTQTRPPPTYPHPLQGCLIAVWRSKKIIGVLLVYNVIPTPRCPVLVGRRGVQTRSFLYGLDPRDLWSCWRSAQWRAFYSIFFSILVQFITLHFIYMSDLLHSFQILVHTPLHFIAASSCNVQRHSLLNLLLHLLQSEFTILLALW